MGNARETGEDALGGEVEALSHPGEVPGQAVMTSKHRLGLALGAGCEAERGIGVWADNDVGGRRCSTSKAGEDVLTVLVATGEHAAVAEAEVWDLSLDG